MDKALVGKMYNRSVRSCKLMREAVHRLLISSIKTSHKNYQEKHQITASRKKEISPLSDDISAETFSYLADTESFSSYNNLLADYKVT